MDEGDSRPSAVPAGFRHWRRNESEAARLLVLVSDVDCEAVGTGNADRGAPHLGGRLRHAPGTPG
jgi:hypothetical protein